MGENWRNFWYFVINRGQFVDYLTIVTADFDYIVELRMGRNIVMFRKVTSPAQIQGRGLPSYIRPMAYFYEETICVSLAGYSVDG